jgi:arginase
MVGQHDRYADAGWPHENLAPIGRVVDPPLIAELGFEPALERALDDLAGQTDSVYLHVDTDVIDADIARSSLYTASGGLTPAQAARAIELVNERFDVAATTFSAYDPDVDPTMLTIVPELMEVAATGMVGPR